MGKGDDMTTPNKLERRLRVILKDRGYILCSDGTTWFVRDNYNTRVIVSGRSVMSVADQMCPLLKDERLTKLCCAMVDGRMAV